MQPERDSFAEAADIKAMLGMRHIAIVGLSSDSWRDSNRVAAYLQRSGYDITPVNPNEVEVLGKKAYASLSDLPEPPDMVDVFRRPEYVGDVVEEAIKVGARGIWIQSGIINYEAARRAREAGLHVVMDRCMMVEHRMRGT
ncbi:MAG TPA: CoA-binding protein [Chloroflexia bacterium]|nr:CoA-binding protein [Chloroflexia bacterium]